MPHCLYAWEPCIKRSMHMQDLVHTIVDCFRNGKASLIQTSSGSTSCGIPFDPQPVLAKVKHMLSSWVPRVWNNGSKPGWVSVGFVTNNKEGGVIIGVIPTMKPAPQFSLQWELLTWESSYYILVGARGRRPLWSPPWVPVTFGHCEVS
jgi:hypothetical protein